MNKLIDAVKTFLSGVEYIEQEENANYVVTREDKELLQEAIDTVLSSKNTEKKIDLDDRLDIQLIEKTGNQQILSSKKDRLYTAEETQDFAEWCSLHNWTCYDSKMWLRMYRGERMTGDAKTTAQLRELWERERRGK